MQRRVQRILLVSSLYDSFILSEEGRLQETLLSHFIDLNLIHVPDVTRVPSGVAALERFEHSRDYDLVISSLNVGQVDAVELKRRLRDAGIFVPVIALGYSNRELSGYVARRDIGELDGVFLWQGDARIFLAIVKFIEDRLNVDVDTGQLGVPAILVVEDNVRFHSSFLPAIYSEIFRHMLWLMSEDLNLSQKMLRVKARPKVLLCRTFEEAWSYFSSYEQHILGVISDIQFPRGGRLDPRAGLELTTRVHRARPDVRIVLQSSQPEYRKLAAEIDASFLLKDSPVLLHDLRQILVERFGFGDFVFRMPDRREVDRAHDLKSLLEKLETVPAESIAYHASRNHFSNWLKARTEFALAEKLRPRRVEDFSSIEELRGLLLRMIGEYRRDRNRAVVADFDRRHFERSTSITRIGQGSLGGKARGLAFANNLLQRAGIDRRFPDIDIHVPTAVVLGTQVFDEFLERTGLGGFALGAHTDEQVLQRFLREPLPAHAVQDLRSFLEKVDFPLAVRSSSLLEDSFAQPFAGVYRTHMLPNAHPDLDVRLAHLVQAVKSVYASAFTREAKAYLEMTSFRLEEEKMAVLIQRVVGKRHGSRYYPDFSGVARSYNFYPQAPYHCEDGVAAVALGLGRTVVDGAPCVRFCPKYPRHLQGFSSVQEAVRSSQRSFYALDLSAAEAGELVDLQAFGLDAAEADGSLAWLGSTWLPEDDRVADGVSRPGQRLVSFAQILKHGAFPLAEILVELLQAGSRGTNGPVEIEFAGNLRGPGLERPEFGFLQLRPLSMAQDSDTVQIDDVPDAALVCRSRTVLGNGRIDGIHDVVVVDRDRFDRSRSAEVAGHVADFNLELQEAGRPYLLVGVGRWGSSDPFLGIPVHWSHIAGARVIVEAGFKDLRVEPSQGTHFFQNLTSSNVGYFTVNQEYGEGFVDWDWLSSIEPLREVGCVRMLRFEGPAVVKIDVRGSLGVILKPENA
ncbi:MAG: histidine kinase [Planctomycetes bacterium]|nr:histidine kinase [Planctomycetota bacterium]